MVVIGRGAGYVAEIVREHAVRQHVAQRALIEMMVRVDEAGQHDHARRVDCRCVGADIRAHGHDPLVLNRTSAFSKSPTAGSKLSTTPPLSRVRTGPPSANAGRAMPATAVTASVAAADLIRARRLTFTEVDRGNLVPVPVSSILYSSDPVTDLTGAGSKHVENDDRRQ